MSSKKKKKVNIGKTTAAGFNSKEEYNEYMRQYYHDNKHRLKTYRNNEERRQYQKEYYEKNKEKLRAYQREYNKRYKENVHDIKVKIRQSEIFDKHKIFK